MERTTGRITRWGARGFGFIECDALDRTAWFHANYVIGGYEPREGDAVSFEPHWLPDGKLQARSVQPASSAGAHASASLASVFHGALSAAQADEIKRRLEERTREPASPPPTSEAKATGLQGLIDEARRARAASLQEAERELDRLRGRAEATRAREREIEKALAAIRDEIAGNRKDEEALGESLEALRIAPLLEATVVTSHFETAARRTRTEVERLAGARATLANGRDQAVAAAGEDHVSRYEHARRRQRSEADPLAREAFAALEEKLRKALPEYAAALDAGEPEGNTGLAVVAFEPDGDAESTVFVFAYPFDLAGADPGWRIACAAWESLAQLVSAEGSLEPGRFAGCLAARLRPLAPRRIGAEWIGYVLSETWHQRATLEGLRLTPRFELVDGALPGFEAAEPPSPHAPDVNPSPARGGTLAEVAARLDVPLRTLLETVRGVGLAAPDDRLDADAEETAARLLGRVDLRPHAIHEEHREPDPAHRREGTGDLDPEHAARARVLRKLLRDRRVGGRHTSIDNVYGHHFSDEEKDLAKEVVRALVQDGILMSKASVGQEHVSINPRRLRDVHRILEGGGEAARLTEGIEA